jgi:hypothetical protein
MSAVAFSHPIEARPIDETSRRSLNDFGFVLGGGASWMVIPQTFSVGVEGLYYFFDKRKTLSTRGN